MKAEHLALLSVIIGAVVFTIVIHNRASECRRINRRNIECVLRMN